MSVTHAHQSAVPNDATKDVSSDRWNAAHTVDLDEADISDAHSSIDHTGLTGVGGGGAAPGAFLSKEFLFTEEATAGVYEATLAMAEGTAVFDVIAYALAAPWVVDESIDGTEAILEVFDSQGAYLYQQSLIDGALDETFDPQPPWEVGEKGGTAQASQPEGWVSAVQLHGWSEATGGSGDYAFLVYGYESRDGEALVPGPLRRYMAADTITVRVTTTLAGSAPNGLLLVKVLYFAAQTPADAVFTPA